MSEPKADGDCYVVSARLAIDDPELTLVHAVVYHPEVGAHGHAWVEREDWIELGEHKVCIRTAIDKSNGNNIELPAELYEHLAQVRLDEPGHYKRYTRVETLAHMLKHQNYGHWELATDR